MIIHVLAASVVLQIFLGRCHSTGQESQSGLVGDAEMQETSKWNNPEGDCQNPPEEIPQTPDLNSMSVWDFIEKTEKGIEIQFSEAVLILGNVGSGKTTLALTVAGELNDLHVYKSGNESFIIVDEKQKIGISSNSRTLVPELISHPEGNISVYDFPGFSKTRPSKEDIVTNFLMTTVTKELVSLKIILTIPEISFVPDNEDLFDLVDAFVRSNKNVLSLRHGIGMVVTKVFNYFDNGEKRDEAYVLKRIREYIQKFKKNEEGKLYGLLKEAMQKRDAGASSSPDEEYLIRDRITLATILLEQENRIALLRSPTKCGNFEESLWYPKNKAGVKKLIMDTLQNAKIADTENAFRHEVNQETAIHLDSLLGELNSNITNSMYKLVERLKVGQTEIPLLIREFFPKKAWYDADYGNLSYVLEAITESTSPKDLGRLMYSSVVPLGYNQIWVQPFENEMKKIETRMNVIDSITPRGSNGRLRKEWVNPLEVWVFEGVRRQKVWYDFLLKLRNEFATFEFQNNKSKTVPTDIVGIKAALGGLGDIVTEEVIQIYENGTLKNTVDLELMWEIINEAFEEPTTTCSLQGDKGYRLTVKGSFVCTLDIVDQDRYYKTCNNTEPTEVLVIATRKFFMYAFIYGRLYLNKHGVELGIISPHWFSKYYSYIRLSGSLEPKNPTQDSPTGHNLTSSKIHSSKNSASTMWEVIDEKRTVGNSHSRRHKREVTRIKQQLSTTPEPSNSNLPPIAQQSCAKANIPDGIRGRDGRDGVPGYHGGGFVGIALLLENANIMAIDIEGGLGGSAENGQPGSAAPDVTTEGHYPWYWRYTKGPCGNDCTIEGEPCDKNLTWYNSTFQFCKNKRNEGSMDRRIYECSVEGCEGGKGGRGGDGGNGGESGRPGQFFMLSPNASLISVQREKLPHAMQGLGGKGGPGGRRGNFHVMRTNKIHIECGGIWTTVNNSTESKIRGKSGDPGNDGRSGPPNDEVKSPYRTFEVTPFLLYSAYREYAVLKYSVHFPQDDFLNYVDLSPEFIETYTAAQLGIELKSLEESHIQLRVNGSPRETIALKMIPHYQSLKRRIDFFIKTKGSFDDPTKKFLSLLLCACVNQLRALKQVMGTPVVVDIQGYMEALNSRLKEFMTIKDESDQRKMVENERERYKETFIGKMLEAMTYISETLDPQAEEIEKAVEEVTKEFQEAIEKMIKESEAKEKELKEAQQKAKRALEVKKLTSPLTGITAMLGDCDIPFLGTITETINRGVFATEQVLLGPESEVRPPKDLDPSIERIARLWNEKPRSINPQRLSAVTILVGLANETVQKIEAEIIATREKYPEYKTEIEKFGFDIANLFNDGPLQTGITLLQLTGDGKKFGSLEEFIEARNSLSSYEGSLIDDFEKLYKEKDFSNPETYLDGIKGAANVFFKFNKLFNIGPEAFEKIKASEDKYKEIVELVAKAEGQTLALHKFKLSVDHILIPFTADVFNEIKNAKKNMGNASEVGLRIQKFEIGRTLKKLEVLLQDMSQSFPEIARDYSLLVSNLQEAMILTTDLYTFIQQYIDQMQFADFIANINTPRAKNTDLGEFAPMYEKINLALLGSMILSEWDALVQNFQQWVFPFSNQFQKMFEKTIPDYLTEDVKTTPALLGRLIPDITKWVDDLTTQIQNYKSRLIPGMDNQLIYLTFNSEYKASIPFHVWKWEKHEREIEDLFSGLPVTFSSTPESTYSHKMSAVKFRVAEINVKARNESHQKEIDELFNELKVEMRHSGTSRYLFNDESFSMVGANVSIQYYFQRDNHGNRLGRNAVYEKLKAGDIILSPFTTWKIVIMRTEANPKFNFDSLANYTKLVDIELIGEGTFVSEVNNPSSHPQAQIMHAKARGLRGNRKSVKDREPLHYKGFKTSGLNLF